MPRAKRMSLGAFTKQFSTEEACREYLVQKRWPEGFVCPKCGHRHGWRLSNGRYQCGNCRCQTSVTAGTVLHRSHVPLSKWFLAFYFVSQDKRGISAVQLCFMLGAPYKTAWYMLARLCAAMGQRDAGHKLSGVIDFDNAYFGAPTQGKKQGRGTEKAKVFVALSLDTHGNPWHLKMRVTKNIKQTSVRRFAHDSIETGSIIISDGYRSYIPALRNFDHQYKPYAPQNGMLHWLHIIISNAKAYIMSTYHRLAKAYLQSYLDEFCFRFSRHGFRASILDRLALAVAVSRLANSKG